MSQAGSGDAVAGADEAAEATEPELPKLHGWPVTESCGQRVLHCSAAGYFDALRALKDDGFDMCVDVCGVDYLVHSGRDLPDGIGPERFEVVVNLLSVRDHRRIRVRAQVSEADPVIPSLFGLWPGTEATEREAYDMVGICFAGHPDLTRILMPEDWEGHPLRKDYAVGRIPVQFKEAPATR